MFNINGENWRVFLVSPTHRKLKRSNGTYTWGVCDDLDKIIYIANNLSIENTKKVLCHEITHSAMFSYNIDLSLDQEELLADLIATYGQEIINITNEIFQKIRKRENSFN